MVINEHIELGYIDGHYYYIDDMVLQSDLDGEEILPFLHVLNTIDIYSIMMINKNNSLNLLQYNTTSFPIQTPLVRT